LPADPLSPHQTADSIAHSLAMTPIEKKWRNALLKRSLHANPLQNWWRTITSAGHPCTNAEEISALDDNTALSA
jgi:trehalose-6-phosphate synthase